ncbi:hypothetical protein CS063_16670 [Sporanaerobium hydrogeniformans]|uniref:Uncharacterized protein n=1 Tax=Sporanaerobium hydrogeniformans TaxID=3072179 RepID=A0AC61D7L8_9FIRM|nr:DUF5658 family protein [Sporanaerobium hydrogeniformans]PHV69288.1 hypothetical protein CS063_16670 [Sporanaerobium hydrogeniformans]
MFHFIKNYSTSNLKSKFTLIYILNCTDILFTYTLLKTGDFFEANKLMVSIVQNAFSSLFIKILLPAFLLWLLFKYLDDCGEAPCLKWCNFLIFMALGLYVFVNGMHLYYLFTLLV